MKVPPQGRKRDAPLFCSLVGWTSQTPWSAGYCNGTGWIDDSLPTLQTSADGTTVAVVRSATDIEMFDLQANGQYTPESANNNALTHANGLFVFMDSQGDQIQFYDFSSGTPTGRQGQMKAMTDAADLFTYVSAWTSGGAIQEIRRQNAANNDAESWLYSYAANTGLLSSVQLRRPNGQGGWTLIQQVVYSYYDGTQSYGNLGDLKTASVEDAQGDVLDTDYYRYYTPGRLQRVCRGPEIRLRPAVLRPAVRRGEQSLPGVRRPGCALRAAVLPVRRRLPRDAAGRARGRRGRKRRHRDVLLCLLREFLDGVRPDR